MKPKEQRIAIAEACGWTKGYDWSRSDGIGVLPDYLNDLNAMHEAEKTLDDDQDLEYSECLEPVVKARWGANNSCDMQRLRSATAAQRAEAFLRAINKWTTNPNEL